MGLPARRRRPARRDAAQLLRLAAPPIRQWAELDPAALLHVLDGVDLGPDRVDLPLAGWEPCGGQRSATRCRCCSAFAWFFNFFIGGATGVFLSDVPSDVATHGSFFVMAHFHYTIMGGLVFAFFAAIYYWVPKMFGLELNEKLGKIHFWIMFIAFNSTFAPLFALGLMGMPRRAVTYAPHLQTLNDWVSISAFVLGASMLVFLYNVVYSLLLVRKKAPANPWESKSLEWQTPTPVPVDNFDRPPGIDYRALRLRGAGGDAGAARGPRGSGGRTRINHGRRHPESQRPLRRDPRAARADRPGRIPADRQRDGHVLPRVRLRLLLPTLAQQRRSLAPHGIDPPQGYGIVMVVARVLRGILPYADRCRQGRARLDRRSRGSLLLGLAGCVAQAFEYAPSSSAHRAAAMPASSWAGPRSHVRRLLVASTRWR